MTTSYYDRRDDPEACLEGALAGDLRVLDDENAIEDAIVTALGRGGVHAWRGDGVAIVANIIRAYCHGRTPHG